jgi:aminomethyltransferase
MTDDPLHSPLEAAHDALGATFTEFAGWRMPVSYSSDLAEHAAVRTAAGLFDLSHMAEILVVGPQAPEAVDAALADPLSGLDEGRAKYTLLEARDGGILDDLVVYRTAADRFLVVANAGNRRVVAEALRERTRALVAAGAEVVVEDETDDIALIALQGPRSEEILRELDGMDAPGLDGLRYYRAIPADFRGHSVLIARTGYTGEDGFEFYLAPEEARELWDALLETGASAGLVPAGLAARDTLRLEAGMPLYGHELDPATRRIPGPRGGTFARGGRRLVGLAGEGRRAARAGYAVRHDGATVGEVTSGALSPTLGHPVALAYVDEALTAPGTALAVDVRGTELPMTVVGIPFYRRPRPGSSAPTEEKSA